MNQESLNYLRVRHNIPLFYIGYVDQDRKTVTFCGLDEREFIVLLEDDEVIEINNSKN